MLFVFFNGNLWPQDFPSILISFEKNRYRFSLVLRRLRAFFFLCLPIESRSSRSYLLTHHHYFYDLSIQMVAIQAVLKKNKIVRSRHNLTLLFVILSQHSYFLRFSLFVNITISFRLYDLVVYILYAALMFDHIFSLNQVHVIQFLSHLMTRNRVAVRSNETPAYKFLTLLNLWARISLALIFNDAHRDALIS